jgi:hypothetical protein
MKRNFLLFVFGKAAFAKVAWDVMAAVFLLVVLPKNIAVWL